MATHNRSPSPQLIPAFAKWLAGALLGAAITLPVAAQSSQVVPLPTETEATIKLGSRVTQSWYEKDKLLVIMLIDGFTVRQGKWTLTCRDGVAWCDEGRWAEGGAKLVGIYAEDNITITGPGIDEPVKLDLLYLTLQTRGTVERPHEDQKKKGSGVPLYLRAKKVRLDVLAKAAAEAPDTPRPEEAEPGEIRGEPAPEKPSAEVVTPTRGEEITVGALHDIRSVTFESRREGDERISIWSGGVQVTQGDLEMRADDVVIWTDESKDAGGGTQAYLEGHVQIHQGQRTIWATRVYYDFDRQQALISDAKIRTFSRARDVPIYYYAKTVRQLAEGKFVAEKATMTTDAFGHPQWGLSGSEFEIVDLSGEDEYGRDVRRLRFTAKNVTSSVRGIPLSWWPRMSGDLTQGVSPLRRVNLTEHSSRGTGIETEWYLWRLLGVREIPDGFKKTYLDLNLYSERGPYIAVTSDYQREQFFGEFLGNFIHDYGLDNIGGDDVDLPRQVRGRVTWRHRHFLPYNWQLTGEVSWLSDRGYLREWYEREDAEGKDQETLLHLKKQVGRQAFTALFKTRVNDFMDEVETAPRLDYHLIGEPLAGDRLTYFMRTTYEYGHFRADEHDWRRDNSPWTHIADTRHTVDMPLQVGFVKVVPFVDGRLSYFEETLGRTGLRRELVRRGADSRIWGAAGARASWYLSRVYPNVHSRLWDLNRLRHVNTFDIDLLSATTDLSSKHLYPYDEPGSAEAKLVRGIDDTDVYRLGWRNRLQTKRGPDQKTVDWMTLDFLMTWFAGTETPHVAPDDDKVRSNLQTDYSWQLSDTTSLVGDMYYTTNDGQVRTANVGLAIVRSPRLGYYIGSRYIRGADSSIGTFGVDYVINRKWKFHFFEQYEFNNTRTNSGTRVEIERRMASWLMRIGVELDPGEDEKIFFVEFEPVGVPEFRFGN